MALHDGFMAHEEGLSTGSGKRIYRTVSEKRRIVELPLQSGASVAKVAQAEGVNSHQVFDWRRACLKGKLKLKGERSAALLPEHLRREDVTHTPEHACCPDCGGSLKQFGQDVSEQLEYVPESFKVIRHVRPKFACAACERVVEAPAPSRPIERGLAGPALLAHVLVSKFCDHQPLYRQSEMYARQGVEIERIARSACSCVAQSMSSPCARSTPAIRLCRCSRPAPVKPKPQGCGRTSAMNALPARRPLRPCGSLIQRTARENIRVRI